MYFLSPSLAGFLHYSAQNISGQQILTQTEVKHKDFLLFMVIEGNIDLFFLKADLCQGNFALSRVTCT